MLFPSAAFLLSALIAQCVADPKNFNVQQIQPPWPPLPPTGQQLTNTHNELAKCIDREKIANVTMNFQKMLSDKQNQALAVDLAKEKSEKDLQQQNCDLRLALLQQNASSNADNLLQKWQTCENRINSGASAGANKTSPKSTQNLIQLSTGYYYISSASEKANWHIASKMCKSYNMELASVETEEENDALKKEIARYKEHFYISGTDLGSEGQFYWASTGKSFGSFQDWARIGYINPDNHGGAEHCVQYVHVKVDEKHYTLWNDITCENRYRYICESI